MRKRENYGKLTPYEREQLKRDEQSTEIIKMTSKEFSDYIDSL